MEKMLEDFTVFFKEIWEEILRVAKVLATTIAKVFSKVAGWINKRSVAKAKVKASIENTAQMVNELKSINTIKLQKPKVQIVPKPLLHLIESEKKIQRLNAIMLSTKKYRTKKKLSKRIDLLVDQHMIIMKHDFWRMYGTMSSSKAANEIVKEANLNV